MKKIATIFAGVNGSGKTTLYYNELEKNKDFGLRINIDEIVSSFGDWKNQEDQFRASRIAIKMRENYIKKAYGFNQETTLCGNSILSLFKKLQKNSYTINLYYIGLDSPNTAKQRVKIRVAKGGHDIKEELIEKRYYESLRNFNTIAKFCNHIIIFDNTQNYKKLLEFKNNKLEVFEITKWLEPLMINFKNQSL
ncbi:zeta toxin family protein [Campylobacter peloridis]|uniref:zeta toxin family protein n=1 Tax=Campylobacter peloridis TaxID=488546 RepID=UPI001C732984|nr:zeta toxin family protein [Campylobacter peloridis]MBX1886206.1 zeta toxin family protein [Campylobacter peloridis]MBX2079178.1 zeta toxin family protein [Campylobacter peloridis]